RRHTRFSRDWSSDVCSSDLFIPITVWRGAAESCAKYLSKGRLVAVVGRIQTGSYEKDGQRHYTTEVVADEVRFLEWGEKGQARQDRKSVVEGKRGDEGGSGD